MTAVVVAPRWRPEARWPRAQPPVFVCSLCSHPLEFRGAFQVLPRRGDAVKMLCMDCQPELPDMA